MAQTNFRAEDFKSSSDKPKKAAKKAEPAPAPVVNDSGVPEGTVDEILDWVGDDSEKAQKALDAENEKSNPRKTLVSALEDALADEAAAGSDENEDEADE